ncbi:hypothetical protein R1sor_012042 [Riccia sorocarpa]|uniref:Uncharacterized protein n=1 Tax=Riccia sorocarpa TaxID=122646 RepID=A0ABD3I3Y0_9MARC
MADAPSPYEATQPQPTPRVRRRVDQSDEPVGPDEVISVHNVHRLVTHKMIMSVFPAEVMINGNRRDFKEDARKGRIRMMIDCTSDAMVDAVAEGYPVASADRAFRRRAILAIFKPEIVVGTPDRDAILNWIDSGPFFLVDRRAHEAARLRLAETDAEEARLRSQLAQVRDGEKAAEQALHLSSTAVGELTVRVSSQEGEIPQQDVPSQPAQAHLSQAQAGTSNPVAQVGTSHAVAGTSNAQAETSNAQAGTSNAHAQADGPPLTEDQKLVINLQAQIASLNERLGAAEEALEIERRRNFADGSERSAWESEKTILERRLEICTQERDNDKVGPVG